MSTVKEIESAVRKLTPGELRSFRSWFQEFDAGAWDRQFADDVRAGRLDALADAALDDLRAGRCRALPRASNPGLGGRSRLVKAVLKPPHSKR
jgi:hypothetical protein